MQQTKSLADCSRECNKLEGVVKAGVRLVSDGAICLADSFQFTIYNCTRLKAFRHE